MFDLQINAGDYVKIRGTVKDKVFYTTGGGNTATALIDASNKKDYIQKIDISEALGPIQSRQLDAIIVSEYKQESIDNKLQIINRYLDEKQLRQSGLPWASLDWLFNQFEAYLQKTTIKNDSFSVTSELDSTIYDWQSSNEEANIVSLPYGVTIDYVKSLLGEPSNTQHSEIQGLATTDFLYYSSWQLVFENGKLRSKNRY